ncbi:MAG: FmdE family protein [Nitrospiraceae bacterium]|nr:FmdE family protein [Nitrospiraceae bacterium]
MDSGNLKKAALFHGHVCPGLAIGVRVAELALKEFFPNRPQDEEIVAVVENDSCAVDAIQLLTGCTLGKGNLILKDYGKQVYTFIKRPEGPKKSKAAGEAIRISVDLRPPEESPKEKEMWRRFSEGDRAEEVVKAVHARRSKKIKAIMKASDDELFRVNRLNTRPPCRARVVPSVRCEKCGEKTMETKMGLTGGRKLCRPCFEKETSCRS